ncbi:SDR family NAD(P)-dependent oxidoreductase [Flavobacterium muglaense]|uniref:SDR family NAD(P)-dependent oxidoreductase n=1 Tax=Flavobacterium muglaense TaxID=2764716 RepID=A0A923SH66_9FLAO|nr:SDR family NAD(P)-dependent oxidoreductase [Flavobacterium muglaense]MBC5838851.1 SDR family NAD(P)-dependent oxidoreductase [Flavobacterium muglaense]MBC5845354.1 SDR family NAD(P)-dependent oxidoreductase [Flavobacterium muglaense]
MKKSIIISGASGNLGKEVVKKLAENGCNLSLTVSNRTPDEYNHIENTFSKVVDLNNETEAKNFVNDAVERKKTIDAAVLLVGGFTSGDIKNTTNEEVMKMININFFTAYNLVRPLLNHFEKQGFGQIILVSSKAAVEPGKGVTCFAYTLSKQMLNSLAQFINTSSEKTVVNIIVPSIIDTPATRPSAPNADYSQWVSTETLAESIAFLVSDTGKQLRDTVLKVYNNS